MFNFREGKTIIKKLDFLLKYFTTYKFTDLNLNISDLLGWCARLCTFCVLSARTSEYLMRCTIHPNQRYNIQITCYVQIWKHIGCIMPPASDRRVALQIQLPYNLQNGSPIVSLDGVSEKMSTYILMSIMEYFWPATMRKIMIISAHVGKVTAGWHCRK